jgi:hypothetical protein
MVGPYIFYGMWLLGLLVVILLFNICHDFDDKDDTK